MPLSQQSTPIRRALFYSHDTVGLGHLRRTLLISEGLQARLGDLSTLILTGSPMAHGFRTPPDSDYVKLPSVRKLGNERYHPRAAGLDFEELLQLRQDLILSTVRHFEPDFLFVDNVPMGMKGELLTTLRWLRESRPRTRILLVLRDIVDEPGYLVPFWRRSGTLEALDLYYDRIFICGSPCVFDPIRSYRLPRSVAAKTRFGGYLPRHVSDSAVRRIRRRFDCESRPLVLVTVGGGVDGGRLVRTYLDALPDIARHETVATVVITGPEMSAAEMEAIREHGADDDVIFEDFTPELTAYMKAADLVVSMAGYNTINEIASLRKRAVVVPRIYPRREQLIRAQRMADLGVVDAIHPEELSPRLLAAKAVEALRKRPPDPTVILPDTAIDVLAEELDSLAASTDHRAAPLAAGGIA